MKKILYIIDRANFYGSERHVYDVINYMNEQSNIEVEFLCFFKGELYRKLLNKGIKVNHLKLSWIESIIKFFILKKKIKEINPDIIHCHQPKALLIGVLIGKLLKKKTIITIHSDPDLIKSSKRNYIYKRVSYIFHKAIQNISENYCNILIYVSNSMIKSKKNLHKTKVIYNWVSKDFEFHTQKKKRKFGKIKILYLSSITYEKGYEDFFEFLGKLKKELPIEIDIVGDGDKKYKEFLASKIKDLGINFKINFWGYQKEVQKFYNNADLFFLFSKGETFGIAYIEAMYYGLPIFSYELPVLKEIIPKENFIENDLLKQVKNLEEILFNKRLYTKISQINQKEARKAFDYYKNMKKLEEIYLEE